MALSAEGTAEATAAVDGCHGRRLAVATERSDVTTASQTRPMLTGGGTTRMKARTEVRPESALDRRAARSDAAGTTASQSMQRSTPVQQQGHMR
jgi:hypothetical protein